MHSFATLLSFCAFAPRVRDRCQRTVGQIEGREIIFALSLCADTIHDFTFQRCDVLLADFAVFDEVAGETSLKIVVRVREPAGVGARELSPVLGFRGGLRRARNRVLTFRTARDACQTCNNDAENRHYAANTDDNISQHRLPITCTHANSPCRTSAVARARLRMTFDMLEPTCRKLSSVFHRLMSTSAHAANTPPVL